MAALHALFVLAAAAASQPASTGPAFAPTSGATASAQATVRILPGAKIRLGESADVEHYLVSNAVVRDETGAKRSARLVEFQ